MAALLDKDANARDLIGRGDLAVSQYRNGAIDGGLLFAGELACGDGEIAVDMEAAPVDYEIENPQRLFVRRQLRYGVINGALDLNVARTIGGENVQLAGRRRLAPARQLTHQAITLPVFLERKVERLSDILQFAGQGRRQGRRHGAAITLDRNDRPAITRRQHTLFDGGLE